jgi:periplasmic protein TonB
MPRDLFASTFTSRPAPSRSKWTIAGSVLAHAGIIAAILIVPMVSALDSFVLRANEALSFAVPAMVMPAPPPPARAASALAPDINPAAAPPAPPIAPVTAEIAAPAAGSGPGVPGAIPMPGTSGLPGLPPGAGQIALALPPAAPPAPVRPGGDIKPPARVAYVAPAYPSIARTARIEGTVILEATIDEAGIVRDVRVLRSIPLLDQAARDAVGQWRYTPTRLNGVPVSVILTVTVTFMLREAGRS